MKCFYYLAPTLESTHQISDDLHDVGVRDWLLHVITKDEAGLKREHIHSSNYFETLDLVRGGLIGANLRRRRARRRASGAVSPGWPASEKVVS